MPIYDTDDNVIYSSAFALRAGESTTATIQIDCESGWSLYGQSVADMTIEVSHDTDEDWTDLVTTPRDLSTWDGSKETFKLRFTAGSVATVTPHAFTLTVKRTV